MVPWSVRAQKLLDWGEEVKASRPWENAFLDIDFNTSAGLLRDIIQKGLMRMTDLRDDPEFFFEAHRAIASMHAVGQGFWTRFTVQFNLFAGTIIAVGSPEQVALLDEMQASATLGCFGLTEKFAGVSSGMVVETVAEYDRAAREFVITSPNEGSYKNWISQGFVADKGVVVADLRIDGKSHGANAFLMDFRRPTADGKASELVAGVRLADMGRKTVDNDLDNAWIAFDGVRIPESALLSKYAGIDEHGNYFKKNQKGLSTMESVGQRLFTGRVSVAQASVVAGRSLFAMTKAYTDSKQFYAGKSMRLPLSMLPQLSSLYEEAEEAFRYNEHYVGLCEAELCKALRADKIPPLKLMEAVGIAKVRCVETTIQLSHRLRQAVGSRALMVGSGFEGTDMMQVAKFAEGESYVLMGKMGRDRLKAGSVPGAYPEEESLMAAFADTNDERTKASTLYRLAEVVMDRTMESWTGKPLVKGIARPLYAGL